MKTGGKKSGRGNEFWLQSFLFSNEKNSITKHRAKWAEKNNWKIEFSLCWILMQQTRHNCVAMVMLMMIVVKEEMLL